MVESPSEVAVHVLISGDNAQNQSWERPLRVVGTPDELFAQALERSFLRAFAQSLAEARNHNGTFLVFLWRNTPASDDEEVDPELQISLDAGPDLTLGQLWRFLGEEASADPATFRIFTDGGRGGDGALITNIVDVMLGAATAWGVIQPMIQGARKAAQIRYRANRRASEDWLDTGVVSDELRQLVKAQGSWHLPHFMNEFRLSREKAPELLRSLGYVRTPSGDGWTDTDSASWREYQ